MKKIYLLFLLFTSFIGAKAFDVTFSVDMNGTGLSNVSLNGTFNGWCGICTPMTDANADGIWEVTVPLTAGSIRIQVYSHIWWSMGKFSPRVFLHSNRFRLHESLFSCISKRYSAYCMLAVLRFLQSSTTKLSCNFPSRYDQRIWFHNSNC